MGLTDEVGALCADAGEVGSDVGARLGDGCEGVAGGASVGDDEPGAAGCSAADGDGCEGGGGLDGCACGRGAVVAGGADDAAVLGEEALGGCDGLSAAGAGGRRECGEGKEDECEKVRRTAVGHELPQGWRGGVGSACAGVVISITLYHLPCRKSRRRVFVRKPPPQPSPDFGGGGRRAPYGRCPLCPSGISPRGGEQEARFPPARE